MTNKVWLIGGLHCVSWLECHEAVANLSVFKVYALNKFPFFAKKFNYYLKLNILRIIFSLVIQVKNYNFNQDLWYVLQWVLNLDLCYDCTSRLLFIVIHWPKIFFSDHFAKKKSYSHIAFRTKKHTPSECDCSIKVLINFNGLQK